MVICKCDEGYEGKGNECVAEARSGSEMPIIAPGAFVTAELYESARRDRERLVKLRQRLESKSQELRRWRSDIGRYEQEFEDLRADAVHGALSDILLAVPAEQVAARLAAAQAFAKYLPADFATKFKSAYEAAKSLGLTVDGVSARESSEQFKKIAEGQLSIRKALLAIPLARENEEARKWLEACDKTYEIAVKVGSAALEPSRVSRAERIAATAELVGEVGGVLYPPLGFGVYATKVGVRGFQVLAAQASLRELAGAMSANWKAEFYLRDKIQRTAGFIGELDRSIKAYEALHPRADRRH